MMAKKKAPLSGHSSGAKGKYLQKKYTAEFTEKQAEEIFNRDLSWLIAGSIAVLVILWVLERSGMI